METEDLISVISATVLKFYEGKRELQKHLSFHGSIAVIADNTTNIVVFSRTLDEQCTGR